MLREPGECPASLSILYFPRVERESRRSLKAVPRFAAGQSARHDTRKEMSIRQKQVEITKETLIVSARGDKVNTRSFDSAPNGGAPLRTTTELSFDRFGIPRGQGRS